MDYGEFYSGTQLETAGTDKDSATISWGLLLLGSDAVAEFLGEDVSLEETMYFRD